MATRIAVMSLGEIVESGPARGSVCGAPPSLYASAARCALTVTPGAGVPDNRMGLAFPNPLEMPTGCKFHPRCPAAMPVCASAAAPVVGAAAGFVRCHLHAGTPGGRA